MGLNQGQSPPGSRWGRDDRPRPGSWGEHILQDLHGTKDRASRFYDGQFSGQLTPKMMEFIGRMEMTFIATSDAAGECDCSFRAGTAGFLRVLDERTIAYPEFRGNGVMASLGNILENPHIGMFMVDFTDDLIGLHVNGTAEILTPAHMQELDRGLPGPAAPPGRRPVQWVLVKVTEAYIHCSKHIPKLVSQSRVRHWGTDNPRYKGGDYFGAAAQKRAEPDPAEPDLAEPDLAEPDLAEPDLAEPDLAEPDLAEPDLAEPDLTETEPEADPVPVGAAEERSMCRRHQRPPALQLASKDRPPS